MKKSAFLLTTVLLLTGCGQEFTSTPKVIDHDEAYVTTASPQSDMTEPNTDSSDSLEAIVYEVNEHSLLLGPQKKNVSFKDDVDLSGIAAGDRVKVGYDGYILASYPEIINNAYSIEVTEKADRGYSYVSRSGDTASFSLLVPDGWSVSDISYPPPENNESATDWGIEISSPNGSFSISWHSLTMGICGTGMTWENTTINGMPAVVYRNEGSEAWSCAAFSSFPEFWLNFSFDDDEKWKSCADDIMEMTGTLEFL